MPWWNSGSIIDSNVVSAPVQAAGGRKHAGGFAGQRAGQPLRHGAIEEILHRRGHIAKPRGAAQRQSGTFLEVAQFGVRGAFGRMSGAVASQTVDTGGTVRSRAWAPGTLSMPVAISSASLRVLP